MKATFQDMQDEHNVNNGACVADAAGFTSLLHSFEGREPFSFMLTGENGLTLTIGWAPRCGSVQYGSTDGLPPYLVAVGDETADDTEFVEFLAGGTPTPIASRFCMPLEMVEQIVADFLRDGGKSSAVSWEEI